MDIQKLLKLNYVPLKNIFNRCDDLSLIYFAIAVANSKCAFQFTRREIPRIAVKITKTNCVIEVSFGSLERLTWTIRTPFRGKFVDKFDLGNVVLKNEHFQLKRRFHGNEHKIDSSCSDIIFTCKRLVDIMLTLFIPDGFEFSTDRKLNISNVLKARGFEADVVQFTAKYPLSDAEFALFFKKVNQKTFLSFENTGYKNQLLGSKMDIKNDILEIKSSEWFTEKTLFGSNCTDIVLKDSPLSPSSVNRYIRSWLKGNHSNLESLTIELKNEDFASILNEISTKKLDTILKELNVESMKMVHYWQQLNFPARDFGFDLTGGKHLRRGDGKVATIQFKKGKGMCFVVWGDEYPQFVPHDNQ